MQELSHSTQAQQDPTLALRAAHVGDAADIAPLLLISGQLPMRYIFGLGRDDNLARGFLERGFRANDGPFSHRHVIVAHEGDTVLGMGVAYPTDAMAHQARIAFNLILQHYSPRLWPSVFLRGLEMRRHAGGIVPDAYYFSGLAVWPQYRGRRLGERFTQAVVDRARALRLSRVQLHVSSHNPRAQAIYERCGFTVVRTYSHPRLEKKAGMGAEILMELVV